MREGYSHTEYRKKRKRSFVGYFSTVLWRMRARCATRKHYLGLPCMNDEEWKVFMEDTIEDRKVLFDEWKANNYSIKFAPSIDRIDPTKGYTPDNCRWLPNWKNCLTRRIVHKTVCKWGHPLTVENRQIVPLGSRCRACNNMSTKKRKAFIEAVIGGRDERNERK